MMDHPLREYTIDKFKTLFPGKPIKCKNAEAAVYNWTVKNSESPSWDNKMFRWKYKHRLLSILFNAQKNPDFIKTIKMKDLEHLNPGQMWPEGPLGVTEKLIREKEEQRELNKLRFEEDLQGILTCPKCKSKKTSYYQLQTRSADEPLTNYCSCLCGHHWRFC